MNTERIERLEQLADELASMDAATVAVTEDYRLALDNQRRELTRLVARMNAARAAIRNSPFWTQTKGTGVGALLLAVDAMLVSDAVTAEDAA